MDGSQRRLCSERESMPLAQVVADGWLQEANRLFFHPRGLSLAVEKHNAEGTDLRNLNILDFRADDREGVWLGSGGSEQKAEIPERCLREREAVRMQRFGWVIQPITPKEEGGGT